MTMREDAARPPEGVPAHERAAGLPWDRLRPEALLRQFRSLLPTYAGLCAFGVLVLAGILAAWHFGDVAIGRLVRDPLAVVETALLEFQRQPEIGLHDLATLEIPFYAGVVSNIGILIWTAAGAVSLFTAFLLRERGGMPSARFFLFGGLLTVMLLLDDFFLLHERALPQLTGHGELWLFAFYGLYVLLYLAVYARTILETEFLLLATAFGFFALGLSADIILADGGPPSQLTEDGAKFAGILFWAAYYLRTAAQALRRRSLTQASDEAEA